MAFVPLAGCGAVGTGARRLAAPAAAAASSLLLSSSSQRCTSNNNNNNKNAHGSRTQPAMIRAPPHRVATKPAPATAAGTTAVPDPWATVPDAWSPASAAAVGGSAAAPPRTTSGTARSNMSVTATPTAAATAATAYVANKTTSTRTTTRTATNRASPTTTTTTTTTADTTTADDVAREAARVVRSKKKDVAAAALASAVRTARLPTTTTGNSASLLSSKDTPPKSLQVEDPPHASPEPMRREVLGRESYYLDLDVVDPTAPASAHTKASRRRRATSKPSSEDSIRCYLHEIGEVKLLGARAEVHLARDIAKLLELERISMTYKDKTGREPTIPEWAKQAGMDVEAFRDTLRRGLRAKERMVAANLRLVVSIAKKYLNRGLTFQDLIQEGSIGLIRGAEKFDADKGFKFSTYATWWIRQAITRAIADHSRPIRLPVHVNDTIAAIKKTSKILHEELNRTPTEIEIGERMNISVEKLRFLNGSSRATISLETPISRDTDSTATLGSFIVYPGDTPEETAMQNLLREDLENVLNTLTPRERDVVRMRYGFDDGRTKTLEEIGSLFSVTRERIRQIESKALRKLRHPNRNAVLREWVYDS